MAGTNLTSRRTGGGWSWICNMPVVIWGDEQTTRLELRYETSRLQQRHRVRFPPLWNASPSCRRQAPRPSLWPAAPPGLLHFPGCIMLMNNEDFQLHDELPLPHSASWEAARPKHCSEREAESLRVQTPTQCSKPGQQKYYRKVTKTQQAVSNNKEQHHSAKPLQGAFFLSCLCQNIILWSRWNRSYSTLCSH